MDGIKHLREMFCRITVIYNQRVRINASGLEKRELNAKLSQINSGDWLTCIATVACNLQCDSLYLYPEYYLANIPCLTCNVIFYSQLYIGDININQRIATITCSGT